METIKSFSSRLAELSADAFSEVKKALNTLGNELILDKPITLHIDPCNDLGFIYNLEARKILLKNGRIIVLSDKSATTEPLFPQPDECWSEGGEFYAEWEGLLELFDEILNITNKKIWKEKNCKHPKVSSV